MTLETLVIDQAAQAGSAHRTMPQQMGTLDDGDQERLAAALKEQAEQFLRADFRRCLATVDQIYELAAQTGRPSIKALALLAEANARYIGLGEYQAACALYDQAAAIYETTHNLVEQARTQIGKLGALTSLGHYDEAQQIAAWAGQVLEEYGEWFALARLTSNLAVIHFRRGQDAAALVLFDRAQELYSRTGRKGSPHWLRAEFNRAIVLRNLGRFDASIEASQAAAETLSALGQRVEAARARQSLAITYFVLGRYNEAMALLDRVRDVFLADGRRRDAFLAELFISDCLLQLRRFPEVLDKCREVRSLFSNIGTQAEVAQAILNEAVAYAGLEQYAEAAASLVDARHLFEADGNPVWIATADLEKAAVLLKQAEFGQSLALAETCAQTFEAHGMPVAESQALLVAAQAAMALGDSETAARRVQGTLAFAKHQDVPLLSFQGYYLLGRLAAAGGRLEDALHDYEAAARELERLRGRLMVEFRASFVEDKASVYQEIVGLCLDLEQPQAGLAYAERAKSQALLSMLAFRLELGIEARDPRDEPLVARLLALRAERDNLYRRWEAGEGTGQRGETTALTDQQVAQQNVLKLEKEITELWHKLLVRNADYARDAALWQVRSDPVQPYLEPDTLLLEYFTVRDELVVFLVTNQDVRALRWQGNLARIQHLLRLFWLNLSTVPQSTPQRIEALAGNARGILQQLYDLVLAPLASELQRFARLIVVPHGPLHYLPFHALHDGTRYLLQDYELSYLPGASLLHYCRQVQPAEDGLLAVGNSYHDRLPYTVQEAQDLAEQWQGQSLLESAVTRDRLSDLAGSVRMLHLAMHGDFRPDNPLFSGLALADGWLTTLDIFNLRLKASLVTLSACQTGRTVVGGGDELLGLMRAFLAAGAASLVLSLWSVEDRSTAALMQAFYTKLAAGWTKGAALRYAQSQFLTSEHEAGPYAHPYFWAPFFLVGDAGPL